MDTAQPCRPTGAGRSEIRQPDGNEARGSTGRDRAAFVFMAAPSCSSYITGEILAIVGGYQ